MNITEFSGDYRWLSNFWPTPIIMDGVKYRSVECAYQAAKSTDPNYRQKFVNIKSGDAKRLGKEATCRSDWVIVKVSIMHKLVTQKFNTNDTLRQHLLDTNDVDIIEGNTWGDTFWGVCDGKGDNKLGKIIMSVRDVLVYGSSDIVIEPVINTQNPMTHI
jgi:ribA/ribD-fused uncharacterized protein